MTQNDIARKVLDAPMMYRLYQDVGFYRDKNNLDSIENRLFANSLSCLCKLICANVIDARGNAEAYMGIHLAEVTPPDKAHELGRVIYALTKSYMDEEEHR